MKIASPPHTRQRDERPQQVIGRPASCWRPPRRSEYCGVRGGWVRGVGCHQVGPRPIFRPGEPSLFASELIPLNQCSAWGHT